MDMQAQMGGAASHFGGPSAFAEIMSALHALMFDQGHKEKKEWHELFHFVNDAGHCENGIYALKANYGLADLNLNDLKGFRSIESKLTGHGEVHLFREGVYISNGPLGSGLPQAQGLAYADYLSNAERVTVTTISDGGCMEGEARESLAAIPGLAANNRLAPFVLIISDNNTKLSGRIDEDAFSMRPSFEALSALGWDVVPVEEGHNLELCVKEISQAIERARSNPQKPVALHVKTIKGFGTKKTAASSSGGHGFPLSDPKELKPFLSEIYGSDPVPAEFISWADEMIQSYDKKLREPKSAKSAAEKVQAGISRALISLKKEGYPIVSVSADLPGSTGLGTFQKEFPDATQDVGVAESNMISMAIGLSKEGYIPIVDTFSQFGVTKGALPMIMSALSEGPLIGVFSHAGFQDAADGASHQALTYFSMTASLPNVEVFCLTSSQEAETLMTQAVLDFSEKRKSGQVPVSRLFFLGRENFPPTYVESPDVYKIGQAQVIFDNTKNSEGELTIVASGPLLHQALEAAYELEKEGIALMVVNPSVINKPDTTTIRGCLRNTKQRLLTVEDHQRVGGMGSILAHALLTEGIPFKLKSLGVDGRLGQSAYKALDLYKLHGLDASSIVKTAKEWIQ